jgi:hypothetical protein
VVQAAEAGSGDGPNLSPALRGAFGQTCMVLCAPPLAAILAALPASCSLAQPATADLVAYNAVIAHVHAQQTTIPLRFGGVFDSEEAVRAHLGENAAGYQRLLDRLRGTEELAVRVVLPAEESQAAGEPATGANVGTGAAYLRARQARYAQAARRQAAATTRADWLTAALMPHVRAHRVELAELPERPEQITIKAAFLIARGTAAVFREKARALASGEPVSLTVSGPFPPYSFAELEPPAPDSKQIDAPADR